MGNTISENKGTVITLIAAASTALGGYLIYKQYKSQQPSEDVEVQINQIVPKKNNAIDIKAQILKFKSQINSDNPTLDDIKRLFTLLSEHVKGKTLQVSEKFKVQRRKKFPKERRFSSFGDYFRFSIEGIMTLQKKIMELQGQQTQLLGLAGVSQAKFAQYAAQLGPFMQELIFSSDIKVEELKRSLEIKTEYLQAHGQRLVQALSELSASLSVQQKQTIPLFFTIIISDQAFENDPHLDKQQFDMAYEKYKNEVGAELTQLEQILMPLMQKLQMALMGDQMGTYGGYPADQMGAYGGYPPDQGYGDYDQMGGMGMNEQMMMQQLQQLRVADPQAYEQLMMMMQAQAGMGR